MNTYFIKGISCEAIIGAQTWQKSVAQKLIIDMECRLSADANTSIFLQDDQNHLKKIINSIVELISSKHWLSLQDIAEQIKKQIQLHINAEFLQIKVVIPNALAQIESVGIMIQIP